MTSGENFRKKKEEQRREEERKKRLMNFGKRNPEGQRAKKRILFITEGTKTEPLYIEKLCNKLQLPCNLNEEKHVESLISIKILNLGQDPSQIVEQAKKELVKNIKRKKWDIIYCIFDRDIHTYFQSARDSIYKLNEEYNKFDQEIKAITSHRCFELWFILHFQYTTKNYSCYNELLKDLKNCNSVFRYYEKGDCLYFEKLLPFLNTAHKNTKKLREAHNNNETESYTDVDILIQHLVKEVLPRFWEINQKEKEYFFSFLNKE